MINANEKAASDMIYLAGCMVNSIMPDQKRIGLMNPQEVCAMSHFCSLSALTWRAIESVLNAASSESKISLDWDQGILQRWKEDHYRAFLRNAQFDQERTQVYSFLEEEGIWYMPLKGVILKDFYPEPYLREMVDNDILYDSIYQKRVHKWFLKHGYTAYSYKVGSHDCYQKKPIYNFEMHVNLSGYFPNEQGRGYNDIVMEQLVSDKNGILRRRLKDEDFYVYLIMHWYKHHEKGGIGIRSLLDCYLYTKAKGDELDWEYIQSQCACFGTGDYEKRVRILSQKLFNAPERFSFAILDEEEKTFLKDFLNSGSYGTMENRVRKGIQSLNSENGNISRRTKFRYLWKRAFPDAEYMALYAPVFANYKWLIPAGYVYRIIRGSKKYYSNNKSELRILRKI